MTGRLEVRSARSWTRFYAADKHTLLNAERLPACVPANLETWDQTDRPVCLEVESDGNDLYLFGPLVGAPGWWNDISANWNAASNRSFRVVHRG
jgi:hypothetical protein